MGIDSRSGTLGVAHTNQLTETETAMTDSDSLEKQTRSASTS